MCPFAPCTAAMMEMGRCLTFITAVAIRLEGGRHPSHTIVLRNRFGLGLGLGAGVGVDHHPTPLSCASALCELMASALAPAPQPSP